MTSHSVKNPVQLYFPVFIMNDIDICIYCGLLKSVLIKLLQYLEIVFCFMLVVSCKGSCA